MHHPDRRELEAAALAARLIAAEGMSWSRAFREALAAAGARPDPDRVAGEIRRWFALFAPAEHARTLLEKRRAALFVMRRAPELGLRLVGVVLSGAATENSLPELVVTALEEKEATLALLNAGFDPEPFDEPYPTAYVRRLRGGRVPASSIVLAGGEPVLVRMPPAGTPLPAPGAPDDLQAPWEAAGSAGAETLARALESA